MGDDPESARRKKLLFRAWHRGTREADLLLGRFADRFVAGFDRGQLDRFDALLERRDDELYAWIAGLAEPDPAARTDVMEMLLQFRYASP